VADIGSGSDSDCGKCRCSDHCSWEGSSSIDNSGVAVAVAANVVVAVASGSVRIPLQVGIRLPVVARCSLSEAARYLRSRTVGGAVSTP